MDETVDASDAAYWNGMDPWPENEVMDVSEDGCWIDCALHAAAPNTAAAAAALLAAPLVAWCVFGMAVAGFSMALICSKATCNQLLMC